VSSSVEKVGRRQAAGCRQEGSSKGPLSSMACREGTRSGTGEEIRRLSVPPLQSRAPARMVIAACAACEMVAGAVPAAAVANMRAKSIHAVRAKSGSAVFVRAARRRSRAGVVALLDVLIVLLYRSGSHAAVQPSSNAPANAKMQQVRRNAVRHHPRPNAAPRQHTGIPPAPAMSPRNAAARSPAAAARRTSSRATNAFA